MFPIGSDLNRQNSFKFNVPPRNGCWDRSAPEGTDNTLSSFQPARNPMAPQFPNFGNLITTFQNFGDLICIFQNLGKIIDFTFFFEKAFFPVEKAFFPIEKALFLGGAFFKFLVPEVHSCLVIGDHGNS